MYNFNFKASLISQAVKRRDLWRMKTMELLLDQKNLHLNL